jgi:hypothetical protein
LKEIALFNKNLAEINAKILARLDNDAFILAKENIDVANAVKEVKDKLNNRKV